MKVAVLLSGHIREGRDCYQSLFSNIISQFDTDVFIDTYENQDVELWNPKRFQIEPENVSLPTWVHRAKSFDHIPNPLSIAYMWRKIKRSFDLIDDSYDAVLKTRFDCKYTRPIEISNLDKFNIPVKGDWVGGIHDMLCFSSMENMRHYCSLYDCMEQYINEGWPLHSELLLKRHLMGKEINRWDYPILLRKKFDNPYPEDRIFTL